MSDDDDRRSGPDSAAAGRAARRVAPRSTLGSWQTWTSRPDPVELLSTQEASRVPDLIPLRHERMAVSPFTFYRGAAAVMAADLSSLPNTGLDVQLCGDAHLSNFGIFAAPDRRMVVDLNDFDETLPGPFEWDVARLAASMEIAARSRSFGRRTRARTVEATVRSYVDGVREFSAMGHLDLWYARLTPDDLRRRFGSELSDELLARFERALGKARRKDRMRAFDKLVEVVDGEPRFRSDPPVLVPAAELLPELDREQIFDQVGRALRVYRRTLAPDRRKLLDRYRFVDLARKVVGVGSVGTRCWVALLVGRGTGDPLFLQVKEAGPSVMEPYLGRSRHDQHGERVVRGQQLIQSAPDVFLGWERLDRPTDGGVSDYYFRQLWDWKGSADVDTMSAEALAAYGRICGLILARAHVRTGDGDAIAAYLGSGDAFSRSLVTFSASYADQNDEDHAAFVAATANGATSGGEDAGGLRLVDGGAAT